MGETLQYRGEDKVPLREQSKAVRQSSTECFIRFSSQFLEHCWTFMRERSVFVRATVVVSVLAFIITDDSARRAPNGRLSGSFRLLPRSSQKISTSNQELCLEGVWLLDGI